MYPEKYIEYLIHFHGDRDYFECHEILEEYWKQVDKNNKNSILVGFILLAVSCYHHRRENFSGAHRTLSKALNIFQEQRTQLANFGFEPNEFFVFLQDRLSHIQSRRTYTSMNLPIQDQELIVLCKKASEKKKVVWCQESDLSNKELVHRHALRDRSDVIAERNHALQLKRKKGSE
ncbi:DUF309 domain-containing protein [Robertmurraya yapensis]|uniref:DUF309 domain-containing protein n=2 Tax=Bacillaceae TaxID=186817 RepID=A0A431W4M1_9BACI|nr:DUF309 domain-containing protein [Bacillus yapensis]RTR30374.1 DUF309 domain-containing protein [Bacillus yapensis]TKS95193.1 DUF309 domain-containing protein [Bacillus yapensis]